MKVYDKKMDASAVENLRQSIGVKWNLNEMYTFENFMTGTCNQFAQAAAYAVVDDPSIVANPLLICGDHGLGKTHLIQAIAHHAQKRNKNLKVPYICSEMFLIKFVSSLKNQTLNEFRKFYQNIDILLIGHIDFLAGKEKSQEEFIHIFNSLFKDGKRIVMTSLQLPKDVPHLNERLKSCLESGLIVEIKPPEYETRVGILKKKAEYFNFTLPHEVVMFIAKNNYSSVSAMEGALIKVVGYCNLADKPITLKLAKELLKDVIESV